MIMVIVGEFRRTHQGIPQFVKSVILFPLHNGRKFPDNTAEVLHALNSEFDIKQGIIQADIFHMRR